MTNLTKLVSDAHIDDFRREAQRAALQAAAVRAGDQRSAIVELPITIRRAKTEDEAAVIRLAALDSARVPAGPVMLAESSGELRAALSLNDGEIIADPFHPTAAIVELLVAYAARDHAGVWTRS